MKRANISTTKNNLSKLLDQVRKGESVLIVDRNTPVARLEPVSSNDLSDGLLRLERDGIVSLPEKTLDVETFLRRESRVRLSGRVSAVEALLGEREAGR